MECSKPFAEGEKKFKCGACVIDTFMHEACVKGIRIADDGEQLSLCSKCKGDEDVVPETQ